MGAKKLSRINVFTVMGAVILISILFTALFGTWMMPYDPYEQNIRERFKPPNSKHWFGTDRYGRDGLSRLILGTRYSITIAFTSITLSAIIGTMLGIITAYKSGFFDSFMMLIVDIVLSFPSFLIGIMVIAATSTGFIQVIGALAVAFTPRFIRVARGSSLSVIQQEFILAAKTMGASDFRIIFNHIMPNIIAPVVIMGTLWVGAAILIESGLSFLGLGVQPPQTSWGLTLKYAVDNVTWAPWTTIFPGLAISLAVVGLNIIGDTFRDVWDPQSN